jgi:hypothetical protein
MMYHLSFLKKRNINNFGIIVNKRINGGNFPHSFFISNDARTLVKRVKRLVEVYPDMENRDLAITNDRGKIVYNINRSNQ